MVTAEGTFARNSTQFAFSEMIGSMFQPLIPRREDKGGRMDTGQVYHHQDHH